MQYTRRVCTVCVIEQTIISLIVNDTKNIEQQLHRVREKRDHSILGITLTNLDTDS